MIELLNALSLLGYCFVAKRSMRWPIEATPFFVISFVICLFYLLAYSGQLNVGSVIFIGLGIFLFFIYFSVTNFTPGFIIFLVLLSIFGFLAHFIFLSNTDELSRWAPHTLYLLTHHTFWDAGSNVLDKNYPPGSALFYYFLLKGSAHKQGSFYSSQVWLLLAPLVIFLHPYNQKNWINGFIVFSLILAVLIFAFHVALGPVGSLLVDHPVGIFFGGVLSSYLILRHEKNLWFYLAPPCGALILLKPMVFPFILIIAAIVASDQWLLKKKTFFKNDFLHYGLATIAVPFVLLFSWSFYIKNFSYGNSWSFSQLCQSITSNGSFSFQQFHQLLPHYFHSLITPIIFFLFVMTVIFWIYQYLPGSLIQKRFIYCHLIFSIGYISYILLLSLIYLFLMPEISSLTMYSFDRFMSIYYIGWFLVLFSHFQLFLQSQIRLPIHQKIKPILMGTIILFSCLYIGFSELRIYIKFHEHKGWSYLNQAMAQVAESIKSKTAADAKIYILWNSGYNAYMLENMLAYFLFPRTVLFLNPKTSLSDVITTMSFNNYLLTLPNEKLPNLNNPLTTVNLCADKNFSTIDQKDCKNQDMPIFLYQKVSYNKQFLVSITNKNAKLAYEFY